MSTLENNIRFISRYYYQPLMSLPNVLGVGLGNKFINGYNTKEPCIHVLVKNKLPSNSLNSSYLIPKTHMGIKTDVIELGGTITQSSVKDRIRPLESGYSVGPTLYKGGTLSCIVFREKLIGRNYYLLSNNHVFANNNEFPPGTKIIQPAHQDGGRGEKDLVGILSEFVPLKFKSLVTSHPNYVDAAIAKVTKINLISNRIAKLGKITGVAAPKLDEHVWKVGRTTGLTGGTITTIDATATVATAESKDLFFKNQIFVNINQDYGDSGSLLVNEDFKAVGLLMGGPSSSKGVCNDFRDVLKYTETKLFI